MKGIIQAIQTKIQAITGVKYVDEDWGQLDYFSPNFPVKFPCVLIDVANANYSNIGQDKQAMPINRQMADATISLTIANMKFTNSSGMAPQSQKDNTWSIHELIEEIHKVVQGFRTSDNATGLIRIGMNRTKRDDGVQEYTVRYSISLQNV